MKEPSPSSWPAIFMAKKRIVIYMPVFGPISIHPKVFKSFVEMAMEPIEGYEVIPYIHTAGPSLDFNRNDAVARILDLNPDFIFFVDSDMVFPKFAIKYLLESIGDAGACTGLYWRKAPPHRCVIGRYTGWDSHNSHYRRSLESLGFVDAKGQQCLFYKAIDELKELSPIDVFGMGVVLIKADVFRQLDQPYFKYFNGYQNGDHSLGTISEEMAFCAALHKKGIKVLADPRVKCGHITEKIVMGPQFDSPRPKIEVLEPLHMEVNS